VSEGVSPSEENATFSRILYPMGEVDANTGKVEVENGKNVPMEQSDTIYVYLGVGLLIIAIGVVLVVIIVRKKGIGSTYFINSEENTVRPRTNVNPTS
jgi:hypothetical protein